MGTAAKRNSRDPGARTKTEEDDVTAILSIGSTHEGLQSVPVVWNP